MSSEPDYSLCPACPEIKKKIDRIDLALMGPDGTGMKEGIVHAIIRILLFLYSVFIFIMSNTMIALFANIVQKVNS